MDAASPGGLSAASIRGPLLAGGPGPAGGAHCARHRHRGRDHRADAQNGHVKNSGLCPKCGSADLIRLPGRGGPGSGNIIMTGLHAIPITRYVCFRCGFSEEWIESRADLQRLRDAHGYARDDQELSAGEASIKRQLGLP